MQKVIFGLVLLQWLALPSAHEKQSNILTSNGVSLLFTLTLNLTQFR
jgi:hypothetical protein